jgi:hypothetical protein
MMQPLFKFFAHNLFRSKVFLYALVYTLLIIIGRFLPMVLVGTPQSALSMMTASNIWVSLGIIPVILAVSGYGVGEHFGNKAFQTCVSSGFKRQDIYLTSGLVSFLGCLVIFIIDVCLLTALTGFSGVFVYDRMFLRMILAVIMLYTMSRFLTMAAFVSSSAILPVIIGWLGINIPGLFGLLTAEKLKTGYIVNYFSNMGITSALFAPDFDALTLPTLSVYIAGAVLFDIIGIKIWQKTDLK